MTASNVSPLSAPKPTRSRRPAKKAPASVVARQAEAEDGYVTVEQCGVTLRIPTGGKVPIAALDAFRDGDNYEGNKRMIGDEQWQLLSDAGMTRDGLSELAKKVEEAVGN